MRKRSEVKPIGGLAGDPAISRCQEQPEYQAQMGSDKAGAPSIYQKSLELMASLERWEQRSLKHTGNLASTTPPPPASRAA